MAQDKGSVDLRKLEENAAFRAEFSFFLRLAETYVWSIFWSAFLPKSNPKKRLWEKAKEQRDPFAKKLLDPRKRQSKTVDVFNEGFTKLLRTFTEDEQKVFCERMKAEHGLFLRFDDFTEKVDYLRKKRNWLNSYDYKMKQLKKGTTTRPDEDAQVLDALGRFLLPQICTLFEDKIIHHANNKTLKRFKDEFDTTIQSMRAIFLRCKQDRKDGNKAMFSDERRRNKMAKTKRKALISNARPWKKAYIALSSSPTDYRENTFKLHYTFIGPQNIQSLYKRLGSSLRYEGHSLIYDGAQSERLNFREDIEPFYKLTVKINCLLHRYIALLPQDNEGKLINPFFREIRNEIAHNGLFWKIPLPKPSGDEKAKAEAELAPPDFLSVREIFEKLISALIAENKKVEAACFCDQLESLLRQENYVVISTEAQEGDADTHQPPKSLRIRNWTEEHRALKQKLKSKNIEDKINARKTVRRIVAGWVRDLQRAGAASGLPNAGKNATKSAA